MSNEELINKITKAANFIANKSRKSSSDYMIVHPMIAEAIKQLDPDYKRLLRLKKLKRIIYEKDNDNSDNNTM